MKLLIIVCLVTVFLPDQIDSVPLLTAIKPRSTQMMGDQPGHVAERAIGSPKVRKVRSVSAVPSSIGNGNVLDVDLYDQDDDCGNMYGNYEYSNNINRFSCDNVFGAY